MLDRDVEEGMADWLAAVLIRCQLDEQLAGLAS
jgi:hypothetical protein